MRAILFDAETTGLMEPQIVEWAAEEVADNFSFGGVSDGRCCPTRPMEFGAVAQHHIFPEELIGEPSAAEFMFPTGTEYVIGWNVDYDWQAAGSPEGVKRIDLEKIARRLWPNVDCYSQAAIYYFLFGLGTVTRDALLCPSGKRARQDVVNLARIMRWMSAAVPEEFTSLERLWSFSEECRIPTHMPFGKHKGEHIRDVNSGYRRWYLSQADVDPWIAKAFEKYPRH